MNTQLMRTVLIALVSIVFLAALLGIFYVIEVISYLQLKDYGLKLASTIAIITAASAVVSMLLAANKKA